MRSRVDVPQVATTHRPPTIDPVIELEPVDPLQNRILATEGVSRPWAPHLPLRLMAKRSRAREVALQLLYAVDLNPEQQPAPVEEFLAGRLRQDRELIQFARSLVAGVQRNREELDELLATRAENWTLERMAATDRNILRLGAYEILYTDAPPRVAINEAVELAKRFGSKHSAQFVNGVLDRVMHDLRREDS